MSCIVALVPTRKAQPLLPLLKGTRFFWIPLFSLVCLLACVQAVQADDGSDQEAAKHYDQGKAYFRVGEYALCAREFGASYALRAKSGALFNQARCNEELSDLQVAIDLFAQYIASDPDGPHVSEATARKAALKTKLEQANKPDKTPEPDLPKEPVVLEGTLTIVAPAGARILIDSKEVGVGRFEGAVTQGGHWLRVVAEGMKPYQSEVSVIAGGARTIDVLLEEVVSLPVELPVETDSFELGASLATGVKLRGDRPLVATVRAEMALRLGRRVNLGLFAEYGEIDTAGSCGFDMPGATPQTPFDFGQRNQFNNCSFLLPGVQLYVHVLPDGPFDPYLGVAPGIRFGFTEWTPHFAGEALDKRSEIFPAIVVGVRGGINYHPRPQMPGWEVGAYVETSIVPLAQEANEEADIEDPNVYMTLFAGLRSTVAF
jgi:hypothetical protein